ncbi:MAG TPA: cysteine desulfurase family protein [Terriglobales bacterium]|nr:cysteine desulfurase family protein [Terriglobales bacterium]
MRKAYFDHIAATPLHPAALEAMLPYLKEAYGNPQSLHSAGQQAQAAVEAARDAVAGLIGAEAEEVYFTSSGSEANNLAVKGLAQAYQAKGRHLVVSAVEHLSVLNPVKSLEKLGFASTVVPVDRTGRVAPADVGKAIRPDTVLVSVMTANGEVGTLQPVAEIAKVCRDRDVLFHTDAVAAAGSIPLDVKALGVDALSLAGDQLYGPKGSAALFLKRGTRILPQIEGGVQENGRRAGTENVPAIVGLGKAAAIAGEEMEARTARLRPLRDRLLEGLPRLVDHVVVTGRPDERLPHHASFCVEFVEGEGMLLSLDLQGISVSSGSACTSKTLKASHVLLAMGLDHALAQGSLVFSLIDGTAAEDIDHLFQAFPPVIDRLRKMSPLYTQFLKERRS